MRAACDRTREDVLTQTDRAMLRYVDKLTLEPQMVIESDVGALRAAGFSERALLDICQLVAYFNFVNRLADGLGVVLEPEYER